MSAPASAGVDARWMALALSLGRRGHGRVWPNPAVGCVLVRDGRVVGRGWTQPGGRPHAEVVALTQAGEAARGATAYVTLEPCAHTGKTPPCCDALIAAGIARVVVAIEDPDPRVDGGGLTRLRDAGIEVVTGVLAEEARIDHLGFLLKTNEGRPRVTLKLAMSLDGRIATSTGESQWITGPEARRTVHAMRARHDAVMVGAGTVRADLPSLTVRDLGTEHQPVRVVLTNGLDLPREGPLFETAKDIPVWVIHGTGAREDLQDAWRRAGAQLIDIGEARVGAKAALKALGAAGITRVFSEGGGQVASGLLQAGLVDQLVVFSAGMMLGADGQAGVGALGLDSLVGAERFRLQAQKAVGPDIMSVWRRA